MGPRTTHVSGGLANLSLASLLHPHPGLKNLFLERRAAFGWHDGQQIPGATLQVSMLKDLVSLSYLTNSFSFLNYLHAKGRAYHYLNAQFDEVPRLEFRNYLAWAAARNPNIAFGRTVTSVEFDSVFRIRTDSGTVTADHLVVGVGTQPWVPQPASTSARASSTSPTSSPRAEGLAGKRVAIVGGGQSGAEAFLDLISRPATGSRAASPGSPGAPTTCRSTTRRSPTTSTCPASPTTSRAWTRRPAAGSPPTTC